MKNETIPSLFSQAPEQLRQVFQEQIRQIAYQALLEVLEQERSILCGPSHRPLEDSPYVCAQRARANKETGPDPEEEIIKLMGEYTGNISGTWEKVGYRYRMTFDSGTTLDAVYTSGDLQVLDKEKRYIFYPDL